MDNKQNQNKDGQKLKKDEQKERPKEEEVPLKLSQDISPSVKGKMFSKKEEIKENTEGENNKGFKNDLLAPKIIGFKEGINSFYS